MTGPVEAGPSPRGHRERGEETADVARFGRFGYLGHMGKDYVARLRAQLGSVTTVAASEAKNQFGQVLDLALRGGAVVITKHDTPRAIMMSIEEFEAMTMPRHKLDALTAEFETMYARMQEPAARAAVGKLLDATPAELGAAAVAGARRKKKR